MKRWVIVVVVVCVLLIGYLVVSEFLARTRDHFAGNEYQAAYQDRLAQIEDSLNRCAREFGKYPKSIAEWTQMGGDAPAMLAPIPHAAAPFEIHLELMDHQEKVLLIFEPGCAYPSGSDTWYLGYSLFNTPETFHWPYNADDIARTKAALGKLQGG